MDLVDGRTLTLTQSVDQLGSDRRRRKMPQRRMSEELKFLPLPRSASPGSRLFPGAAYTIIARSMPETGAGGQEKSENFPAQSVRPGHRWTWPTTTSRHGRHKRSGRGYGGHRFGAMRIKKVPSWPGCRPVAAELPARWPVATVRPTKHRQHQEARLAVENWTPLSPRSKRLRPVAGCARPASRLAQSARPAINLEIKLADATAGRAPDTQPD